MISPVPPRFSSRAGTLSLISTMAVLQVFYCLLYFTPSKNFERREDLILETESMVDYSYLKYKDTWNEKRDVSKSQIGEPFFNRKHSFNCLAILADSASEAKQATKRKRPRESEYEMSQIFANCTKFRERHFYPENPLSQSEAEFPLAFVILLNEHLEQIELLFHAIFASQNFYCFHVDLKAPHLIHFAIENLASCFPDQVYLSDQAPLPVTRESVHTLQAITNCFKKLSSLNRKPAWKYALTLQGHDFPLRTNREMVEILKLHRGMNDVELTHANKDRYENVFEETLDHFGQPTGMVLSQKQRPPIPDERLQIYKGNVAGAFSRPFVDFILENNVSRALLDWYGNAYLPDELYFSTLNHNEFLDAPGGYPGRCLQANGMKSWISRFSIWSWYSDKSSQEPVRNYSCKGNYRNSVCLFSSADLPMLTRRRELFLNKFWFVDDPVAVDCMHEFLFNKTFETVRNANWELPHKDYYMELASVKYGNWKVENLDRNSSDFICVMCVNCEH